MKKANDTPILSYPRMDTPFTLDADASDTGIGAVLSQFHGTEEKVIGYVARSLSRAKRSYSTTKKELLALVWSMKHFAPYLTGKQFKPRTDHNALRWIRSFKEPKIK